MMKEKKNQKHKSVINYRLGLVLDEHLQEVSLPPALN